MYNIRKNPLLINVKLMAVIMIERIVQYLTIDALKRAFACNFSIRMTFYDRKNVKNNY